MKIALLASGQVGLEVARHFHSQGISPVLLVTSLEDLSHGNLIQSVLRSSDHAQWTSKVTSEQVEQIRALELDLIISAWWPFILKVDVFGAAKRGTLNFHPSLLPHGRGKHPNFWCFVEGTPFGVTIHFINAGIDSGEIAFQKEIPVSWTDTGESLHHKACEQIVELFKDNFGRIISGDIPCIKQELSGARLHLAREIEFASQIHPDRLYKASDLLNLLRARTYPPYNGCWFFDEGIEYEIRVEITPRNITNQQL